MRIEQDLSSPTVAILKPIGKEIPLKAGEIIEALVVDLFPGGGLTLKVKDSYLPVRSDIVFNRLDTVSLKVVGWKSPENEIILQLIGTKPPVGEAESRINVPAPVNEKNIQNLAQNISDLLVKTTPKTTDGSENFASQRLLPVEVSRVKVLALDLLRALDAVPRDLSEKTISSVREILQAYASSKGPIREDQAINLIIRLIENKIDPELERGMNPQPGIDLTRIEDLTKAAREEIIKLLSPDLGEGAAPDLSSGQAAVSSKLKPLQDELLMSLPADIRSLPRILRNDIRILLQASLKEWGGDVPQSISRILGQLPKDFPEPHLVEILKNGFLAPERLQAAELKEALENSGIILEAKLKVMVESLLQGGPRRSPHLDVIQNDLKAVLLKFKEIFSENLSRDTVWELKSQGLEGAGRRGVDEIQAFSKEPGGIETLLRDVQTFQTLSKVTDSFYTYLPIQWSELKRGELIFKRRQHQTGENSYSCGIHLNLKQFGAVSAFIYMQRRDFFVTFKVDHSGLSRLIQSHLDDLKENFKRAGLNLKTLSSISDSGFLKDPSDRIESEQTLINIRI
jgi:hypothetical protein